MNENEDVDRLKRSAQEMAKRIFAEDPESQWTRRIDNACKIITAERQAWFAEELRRNLAELRARRSPRGT